MVEQYGIFHLILLISIRVTAEITQFTHGLNDCGKLWETIKKHPKLFEKLFTFTSKHHLVTCATMKDLIQVEWSEEGSNRRNDEDATIYCWEISLKNVEGIVLYMYSNQSHCDMCLS